MSKGNRKSISKFEHLFHIVLTLATSGLWIAVYAARIFLHKKKVPKVSHRSGNKAGLKSGVYEKRPFSSEANFDDEWSEFNDSFSFQIVGESHYRENLIAIIGSKEAHALGEIEVQAEMRKEPDNKFDENAVCVLIEGRKVGHVSKEYSFEVSSFLDERDLDSIKVRAVIGWNTSSPNPPIGVRLDFNF